MGKFLDLDEVGAALDAKLEPHRAARETSYIARAMLDVVRPGHFWRAEECNRGTSAEAVLEAICEIAINLFSAELKTIDCSDDERIRLTNVFLQAFGEGIAEKLERPASATVYQREVGHA